MSHFNYDWEERPRDHQRISLSNDIVAVRSTKLKTIAVISSLVAAMLEIRASLIHHRCTTPSYYGVFTAESNTYWAKSFPPKERSPVVCRREREKSPVVCRRMRERSPVVCRRKRERERSPVVCRRKKERSPVVCRRKRGRGVQSYVGVRERGVQSYVGVRERGGSESFGTYYSILFTVHFILWYRDGVPRHTGSPSV